MEPNKEANKPRISYRYYELPEGELVQAITGEDWSAPMAPMPRMSISTMLWRSVSAAGDRVSWFWKIGTSTIPMVQSQ